MLYGVERQVSSRPVSFQKQQSTDHMQATFGHTSILACALVVICDSVFGAGPCRRAPSLSVSHVLFLDSGPLGLITHPQRSSEALAVSEWLSRWLSGGRRAVVPAIVYYELKREQLRARKTFSIGRLDAFIKATPGRYVPLSDKALRLATEL